MDYRKNVYNICRKLAQKFDRPRGFLDFSSSSQLFFDSYIPGTGIHSDGAKIIANYLKTIALERPDAMERIDFTHNRIGNDATKAIADLVVARNGGLKSVDLDFNIITSNGVKPFCDEDVLGKLISLSFSGNSIQDEGATYLAEAIETNTSLIGLDVTHNEIGDAGATKLGNSLLISPNKELHIEGRVYYSAKELLNEI